jgi:hypothetical protein
MQKATFDDMLLSLVQGTLGWPKKETLFSFRSSMVSNALTRGEIDDTSADLLCGLFSDRRYFAQEPTTVTTAM